MESPSGHIDIDTELVAQFGSLTTTPKKRRRPGSPPHLTDNGRALTPAPTHGTIREAFRVLNIPLSWEKQKVLDLLSNLTKRAVEIHLSLYPSTSRLSQEGNLTLTGPRDFISTFAPNDHDNPGFVVHTDDRNCFLTINRNFNGQPSLSKWDSTDFGSSRTDEEEANKTSKTKLAESERKGSGKKTKSTSASSESITMTFRITSIPPRKTDSDILAVLEKDRTSFKKVSSKIVVCPGIVGNHQSAIITLNGPKDILMTFAKGKSSNTERHVPWDEDNDIKIDSHFRGLTQLNHCHSPEADLVAVTGLDGHAYGSWRHKDTKRMWLQEFLPKDTKDKVRVMVYGYDSSLQGPSTSTAGMMDFIRNLVQNIHISRSGNPTRPLIMIGHSLGCIIVGKALHFCATRSQYSPILDATKLLVFFGAPHKGLNTEDFELMVANITDKIRNSRMGDLVRSLREDSTFLESYSEDMVDIFSRCTVVSLYEGHQTARITKSNDGNLLRSGKNATLYEIVRKWSALLHIPNEKRICVDSDHSNIAKFPNKGDETYWQVLKHIMDKLDEPEAFRKIEQDKQLSSLPRANYAAFDSAVWEKKPYCLKDTRTDLLKRILDWSKASDPLNPTPTIFWLKGMAGTGKSTIARTIARDCLRDGRLGASFFFLKGHNELSNAGKLFTTIAFQLSLGIPGLKPLIYEAINNNLDIHTKRLADQWKHLVLQPITTLNQQSQPLKQLYVVVIDALDECEGEDIGLILSLLSQAADFTHIRLRFLITSRPEISILHGFSNIQTHHQDFVLHNMSLGVVEKDISVYLSSEFSGIRKRYNISSNWPGNEIIQLIARKSVGLFIYAATVCRFLRHTKFDPVERLEQILQDTPHPSPTQELNKIYTDILTRSVIGDCEGPDILELSRRFKLIVGSLVVLSSPLTARSINELLGERQGNTDALLSCLSSVLDLPDASRTFQEIRLVHPSFRDFLLDSARFRDPLFYVQERKAHEILFFRCLELMQTRLRTNICDLHPGSSANEADKEKLENALPQSLQYACRYWIHHLLRSTDELIYEEKVYVFLRDHYLHWLEALSLMEIIFEGINAVRMLESKVAASRSDRLRQLSHDSRRFIVKNRSAIEKAPLQTYISALIFSPSNSIVRQLYSSSIPKWIRNTPLVEEDWDSLLQTLDGHVDNVSSVTFSPDGKLLASASYDNTVRLWDAATGASRGILEGHSWSVNSVEFSPDGKLLASGSRDKTVRLWNVDTGALRGILKGHSWSVNSVAFSPDGKLLASGSNDKTVQLWDTATGTSCKTLTNHRGDVNSVAFSPDGMLLASGSDDKTVRLWDAATGILCGILEGHWRDVNSVAFSPDGMLLASGSSDKTVRLWHTATGASHGIFEGHSESVNSVTFSPDGKLLASGSREKTVRFWDAVTGASRGILEGHSESVNSVKFSPDGKLLASGSDDNTARFWDTAAGALRGTLEGHSNSVWSVAFSPDGKLLASGSRDKMIRLWDTATGSSRGILEGHSDSVWSVAFSPDGKLLASGSRDKTIRLWDAATGTSRGIFEGHSSSVFSVAFSPDGKLLASVSKDNTVRFWDTATGALCRILINHWGDVNSVAFSPDGMLLASGSDDKTVRLWDAATGISCGILEGHWSDVNSVAFSPDGKLLASGSSDKTVRLWDTATGASWEILEGHSGYVWSVAFSPDGKLLASGSADETVRLWDAVTGTSREILEGHSAWVTSVAFSPDGKLLASVSADKTVRLWDAVTGASRKTVEGHSAWVTSVVFSPDGMLLASGSADKTIQIWNTTTGTSRGILEGHSESVNSVAFSPDGKLLASGSRDNTVRLWDVATGSSRGILEGHLDYVQSVAFSPDGMLLASGSSDKTSRLWEVEKKESIKIFEMSSSVEDVSFSLDGALLITNQGIRSVASLSAVKSRVLVSSQEPWSISDEWISYGSRKLVFVPVEFKGYRKRVRGNYVSWVDGRHNVKVMHFNISALTE